MYSWKAIRTLAAVLLLIPIVHLAILVSNETYKVLDPSPEAWAKEVESYVKADRLTQLATDPVVIVGGRRVTLWQDLEDLLAPMPVLNRGIGDATVNDITHYYQNLIGFYHAHTVVLLPGESEFHIRDNKTADELVAAIKELVELDLSYSVTQNFYIFTPLKTPLYPSSSKKIDKASLQLKAWAANDERIRILDANRLLSDRDGRAKPAFFRTDGVNLNEHGYVRLSLILRAQMERDNPSIYGLSQAL
ncbi:MAG: hypothetical protein ACI9DH_000278 [Halioglobus sp.]|jgi:hypothetical protein